VPLKRTVMSGFTAAVAPRAGNWFIPISQHATATSATLGVGTLRVSPFLLRKPVTITHLAADVATVGEAGSKFRMGAWSDDGDNYPGALLVDAGQIAGDSATVQSSAAAITLPAGIIWLGGAVQTVSTTQPTMRTLDVDLHTPVPLPFGTSVPTANTSGVGLSVTGVTGAFAATFPVGAAITIAAPRLLVKAA
jgi:hypothetical protein